MHRNLKAFLEEHPYFLLISFVMAILGLLFVTIDLHDRLDMDFL